MLQVLIYEIQRDLIRSWQELACVAVVLLCRLQYMVIWCIELDQAVQFRRIGNGYQRKSGQICQ